LALLLLAFAAPDEADIVRGRVIAVIDGDTLDLEAPGRTVRVRLAEIDAPEKSQPWGREAHKHLERLVKGEWLRLVVTQANERWGRLVGHVYLEKKEGRPKEVWVNLELVKQGSAVWAIDWSNDVRLARAERMAWIERKGLWAEDRPTMPWEFRRKKTAE
jgi:endonuclease YncB( thermonuclease family)